VASLFNKISKFAQTPQGQRVIRQATTRAQAAAKDPATRAKIEKLSRSFGRRTR
jgi:hypothetical protein